MKTIKYLLLVALLTILPAQAESVHEQLMISINKLEGDACETALTNQLVELRLFLNFRSQNGEEFFDSVLVNYVDYTQIAADAPYYGVAMVELEFTSADMRQAFVDRISKDFRYLIYSNAPIERRTAHF
jgi:hypothetical protein